MVDTPIVCATQSRTFRREPDRPRMSAAAATAVARRAARVGSWQSSDDAEVMQSPPIGMPPGVEDTPPGASARTSSCPRNDRICRMCVGPGGSSVRRAPPRPLVVRMETRAVSGMEVKAFSAARMTRWVSRRLVSRIVEQQHERRRIGGRGAGRQPLDVCRWGGRGGSCRCRLCGIAPRAFAQRRACGRCRPRAPRSPPLQGRQGSGRPRR